jgi:nitroreductase
MKKHLEKRETFMQEAYRKTSIVEETAPGLGHHITPELNVPGGDVIAATLSIYDDGEIDEPANTPIMEIIKQRRSIGQMTQEQPTRAQIERLLEAATYAPNHHVTEPWHFFVLTGAAREQLGEIMETSMRQRLQGSETPPTQEQLWKERMKPMRAPVIIAVTLKDVRHLAGEPTENIEAAAAAVQNMLLAATEMGLATIWRTGSVARDPLVKQWLGLSPEDPIVALVYVGYPRSTRPVRQPTPFARKTTWLS